MVLMEVDGIISSSIVLLLMLLMLLLILVLLLMLLRMPVLELATISILEVVTSELLLNSNSREDEDKCQVLLVTVEGVLLISEDDDVKTIGDDCGLEVVGAIVGMVLLYVIDCAIMASSALVGVYGNELDKVLRESKERE